MEQVQITASDGVQLAATRYAPAGRARAAVVVPGAMGVKQDFYRPFAEFLAGEGMAVLCFDYRGIGASLQRDSLRGFQADLFDWAERDYNAALHAAKAWQPDVPLLLIGHSLAGQLPGLVPDIHLVDGLLTVAAGSGYWRDNAPPTKRFVWLLWYFLVPFYTFLCGYFPGKKLRKVGDLPKGVIYQWSRWCRNPHYVVDAQGKPLRTGYEKMRIPMLSLSFSDDEMMSRRGIEHINRLYKNAAHEHRHISPQEIGARKIGHFGFFRPQFRNSLWQQALAWLEAASAQAQRSQLIRA